LAKQNKRNATSYKVQANGISEGACVPSSLCIEQPVLNWSGFFFLGLLDNVHR